LRQTCRSPIFNGAFGARRGESVSPWQKGVTPLLLCLLSALHSDGRAPPSRVDGKEPKRTTGRASNDLGSGIVCGRPQLGGLACVAPGTLVWAVGRGGFGRGPGCRPPGVEVPGGAPRRIPALVPGYRRKASEKTVNGVATATLAPYRRPGLASSSRCQRSHRGSASTTATKAASGPPPQVRG
jgi:hypothetical protein